ncbi:hypothetical protein RJT34_04349 [Clitoria ternatea]|uniref:Uncharacterized protein n=1 Tax=Clitoria ternatea TaxID=43366 RepID=A0AAN9Q255_CLITE
MKKLPSSCSAFGFGGLTKKKVRNILLSIGTKLVLQIRNRHSRLAKFIDVVMGTLHFKVERSLCVFISCV